MESSRHIRKILVILECQRGLEWCRFCQAFTQCIRDDRGLSLEHWADLTREVTSCCELRLEEAAEAVRLNEEMYVSLGVGRPIFRYDRAQLTPRHPVYIAGVRRPLPGSRCAPIHRIVGDAYDNAMCETFLATLECELLGRRRFTSQAEARMAVFSYIRDGTIPPAAILASAIYPQSPMRCRCSRKPTRPKRQTVHRTGSTPDRLPTEKSGDAASPTVGRGKPRPTTANVMRLAVVGCGALTTASHRQQPLR